MPTAAPKVAITGSPGKRWVVSLIYTGPAMCGATSFQARSCPSRVTVRQLLQITFATKSASKRHQAIQLQKIGSGVGFADMHHLLLQPLEPRVAGARGAGQYTDGE